MAAAKYKLLLTIPLPKHTYIVDLAHYMAYDYTVYISVRSPAGPNQSIPDSPKYFPQEHNRRIKTEVLSYNGDYIVGDILSRRKPSVYYHRPKV